MEGKLTHIYCFWHFLQNKFFYIFYGKLKGIVQMIKKTIKSLSLYIRKFKKNRHLIWVYSIQINNKWKKRVWMTSRSRACHFKIKERKKSFTRRDQHSRQATQQHRFNTAQQHRIALRNAVPNAKRVRAESQQNQQLLAVLAHRFTSK